MTVSSDLLQPDRGGGAHPIHLVDKASFPDWAKKQGADRRTLLEAARFEGKTGFQFAILPASSGHAWEVVSTVANVAELSPWCLAKLAEELREHPRVTDGMRSEPEQPCFSARNAYIADCQAEESRCGEGRHRVFVAMRIHV